MRFEWHEDKNKENIRKHDIGFETALLVFEDPYAITQRDAIHDDEEERFVTLGAIGPGAILFVVHTWRTAQDEEIIRIISARSATSRERRSYEEAHQRAKAGNRRHRGKKR